MSTDMSKHHSEDFAEILSIIEKARESAYRAVNRELISMYWEIGKYISEKNQDKRLGKINCQKILHVLYKISTLGFRAFQHRTSGE